jgi:methylthioribose-1-phosphate isomerase
MNTRPSCGCWISARCRRKTLWLECETSAQVADAIRFMAVRGAPAIGIAAAWGAVLAALETANHPDREKAFATHLAQLEAARPTAVNLLWAVRRMQAEVAGIDDGEAAVTACEALARTDRDRRRGCQPPHW